MNAADLTFGVEIETVISYETAAANGLQIGAYHVGTQVSYLPAGWTAQRDRSLHGNSDETGCEIVSPVLKGAEGLLQVIEVVRILESKGHRVNKTCGVHIHVGWDVRERSQQELARLVCLTGNLEKSLFAVTGSKNRERGIYCKKISDHGDAAQATRCSQIDRYHVLNLSNLATGRKPTVEFRVFSGSTSGVKIVSWVRVCLGIVEMAINSKRPAKFARTGRDSDKKYGGWYRPGVGHTACSYLFYKLGWNKGMTKVPHGAIVSEGLPSMDETKKELIRLAKKYDEAA